jgi:hypothetical protein
VTFQRDETVDRTTIHPADAPYPLPVAGSTARGLAGLDGQPLPAVEAVHLGGVPGAGAGGVLVDLEYADRLSSGTANPLSPHVWLGPQAPPDVLDRLRAAGLVVREDRRLAAGQDSLGRQAPALALWFHLIAGGFAVLLAAGGTAVVATADRRRRAEDLAALRTQGLSRRTADRAGLLAHVLLVLAAAVVGLAAAALCWALTGWAVPVFADSWALWPRPSWPRPLPVLGWWLAAVAVLVAGAAVAAADLRRAVRKAR